MFRHEKRIRMVIAGLERSLDILSRITPSNHKDELLVRIMDMRGKLSEILHELDWQRAQRQAQRQEEEEEIRKTRNDVATEQEEILFKKEIFKRAFGIDENGLPFRKEEPKKEGDEVIYEDESKPTEDI